MVATKSLVCHLLSQVSALQCAHNALPQDWASGPHSSAAMTPAAQVWRSAALTPVCSITPARLPSPSMDRHPPVPSHLLTIVASTCRTLNHIYKTFISI